MIALFRWSAAGLLAAAVLAACDLAVTLPGPEGSHAGAIALLYVALHLGVGILVGWALAGASVILNGATVDRLPALWTWLFEPLRAHRTHRAATLFSAPLVAAGTGAALFVVNVRFFALNNQALAAMVLVGVTFVGIALAVAVHLSAVRWLQRWVEKAAERWPTHGDSPMLWMLPSVGLVLGGLTGAALARSTAVAENWEALDLAPYAGLLLLLGLTAVLEVFTRRGKPTVVLALAVMCAALFGVSVAATARSATLDGIDNGAVHRDAWMARLYLTMAERATDRDKDGFSALFGHGDCDDSDATAFPGSGEGNDCGPDVALEDADAFEARLRGAPAEPAPTPQPAPVPPPVQKPIEVSPSPEQPVTPPPVTMETPPEPEKPELKRPYNVVLITVDTVRADHCSFMGYDRDTTPNLEKLADRSAVFERAYAPSNMTPASIPAMLTGLYPTELYRDNSHFIRFDDKNVFVAEMLADAGYETRGVLTHWYFERRKRSGLYQGFDTWKVVGTKWGKAMEDASTSKMVSDEGIHQLNQLKGSEKPFFLWLHYLDPHKWYVFHDGFDKRWGKRSKDRYDHEIAFTDHHVGRVLRALRAHPAADRTAVIVTSDHGEAFGEHKKHFHGFSVYEDQLRVPLIVHVPGLEPRSVQKRVGLIDLVPTMLDLAGVQPPHRLQGRSWGPDMLGLELPQRLIYAERPRGPHSGGMRALIDGDWKLTWRAAGNRFELYNLAEDPAEAVDLMRRNRPMATKMQSAMASMQRLALDNKAKVTRRR